MEYSDIQFEIQDKEIARIRLNRPEQMNSLRPQMWAEFYDAVRRVQENNLVRVLIVSGNGRAWCVGGDLTKTREQGAHPVGLIDEIEHERPIIDALGVFRSIRVPTLAQVNGYVMAEGFEFLNMFDLIVAAEGAQIGLYANRFAGPASEHFEWLWMMPLRKVREMVYTGETWPAEELYRLGFINKVVPLEKLEDETTALARKIANMNPLTMRLQKESMRKMLDVVGYEAAENTARLYHWIGHHAASPFSEKIYDKRLKLGMHWFVRATRSGAFRDAETIERVVDDSLEELNRQGGAFTDMESLDRVIRESIDAVRNQEGWKGPKIR